jgi:hypothetical protein
MVPKSNIAKRLEHAAVFLIMITSCLLMPTEELTIDFLEAKVLFGYPKPTFLTF